jgi:hypothetical protein
MNADGSGKKSDMCKGCEINRPKASFATVLMFGFVHHDG